jgi:UDP-N-acetyl-D-glucosamine dehydrogenase
VQKDLAAALNGMEAVVFAVRHSPYLDLEPDQVVEWAGSRLAVIDCFGMLDDAKIRRYFELGCEVKALGRRAGPLSCLRKRLQELVPRYVGLSADRSKSRALDGGVVWQG